MSLDFNELPYFQVLDTFISHKNEIYLYKNTSI